MPTVINAAEQQTPVVPPQPGTPAHDAAMVALAESRMSQFAPPAVEEPAKPTKPADVPDKFWNAETGAVDYAGLTRSYNELSTKLGQQKPAAPAKADEPKLDTPEKQKAFLTLKGVTAEDIGKLDEAGIKAKVEELSKPAADPAKVAAESKGVDFEALTAEFVEKGALTPETYASLEAKGYPKQVVDTYIAGKQALNAAYDAAAHEAAGGEKRFGEMSAWAAANVPAAELDAYNAAVISGNKAQMQLAVAGMRQRFETAEGSPPTLLAGGTTRGGDVAGFTSRKEQSAAINDPRYRADPAYRKSVEQKIGNSKFS